MITNITPREWELSRQIDEQGGQIEHWRDRAVTAEETLAACRRAMGQDNIALNQGPKWLLIETAPTIGMEMFVVIAIRVDIGNVIGYTSDPYCVWRVYEGSANDSFSRWPHPFPPTHWMPLPETTLE